MQTTRPIASTNAAEHAPPVVDGAKPDVIAETHIPLAGIRMAVKAALGYAGDEDSVALWCDIARMTKINQGLALLCYFQCAMTVFTVLAGILFVHVGDSKCSGKKGIIDTITNIHLLAVLFTYFVFGVGVIYVSAANARFVYKLSNGKYASAGFWQIPTLIADLLGRNTVIACSVAVPLVAAAIYRLM